jgi:hypothetical protein
MSKTGPSEAAGIADQLRRAFDGGAWHGDSLFEILKGVTAAQAAARPIQGAHTIWELVLHIAAWDGAVLRRLGGVRSGFPAPRIFRRLRRLAKRHGAGRWPRCGGVTRNWSRLFLRFPTRGFAIWFRARKARTTRSITCCMAWCSTSFIMRGRSRC